MMWIAWIVLMSSLPVGEEADVLYARVADVGADYGEAVADDGAVRDAAEWHELRELLEGLPAVPHTPRVDAGLLRFRGLVAAHAPRAQVAEASLQLQHDIADELGHLLSPPRPARARVGPAFWARDCAACHGAAGDGRGPAAAALHPAPAVFAEAEETLDLTPRRVFATLGSGVPGTAMPSFRHAYGVEERWRLALTVVAMPHAGRAAGGRDAFVRSGLPRPSLETLVLTSDRVLSAWLRTRLSEEDAAAALAWLRVDSGRW